MTIFRTDGTRLCFPRGPWCCENGERLGVTVCPECAETSAAYQSCMGPQGPCLQISGEDFVFFVYPDMERDLRTMAARARWQAEYRNWRQSGRPEATPQQILAGQYLPRFVPLHELSGFMEWGSIESVRFITSEKIKLNLPTT